MRFTLILALFAGFIFSGRPALAQSETMEPDIASPTLEANRGEPVLLFVVQQPEPPPPVPEVSQERLAADEARARQDGYRDVLKSAKAKKQFVHCKLKNGKVLTGTVQDAGYEAFTLQSNILGDGTYVYYKDLAEPPQPVVAVGTRLKQGAQWAGLGIVVAVAIPLLIIFSPVIYASGWRC